MGYDQGDEAQVKEALVKGLLGDAGELKNALKQVQRGEALLSEMLEEGLVTDQQLEGKSINGYQGNNFLFRRMYKYTLKH